MQSKYSLHLGKYFGIRVSVHWSFSLLIAWIVFVTMRQGLEAVQILMHILFILTLFVCVVLHEFGHSLTAIRYGGEVHSITLLPIGGMANITKMPEKPKEEFLVSLAGPAVNIVIAGILGLYIAYIQPVSAEDLELTYITGRNFPVMLLAANLFIVAFNLIPAFPMDGGRLVRSALAVRMSRMKATRIAKNIGQVFAILFIIAGFYINPFLVIIGFFVLLGARGEYEIMKYQNVLQNHQVHEIILTDYEILAPNDTLEKAIKKLQHMSGRGFVIKEGDNYAGLLTQRDLINGLGNYGKEGKVEDVMNTEIKGVGSDLPVFEALKYMRTHKYDMAPVMDNGEFKGILETDNINEFYMIRKALQ
ncbi:MAG: site-2 protease family protein [Bacteroidota bacterium]